MDKILNFESWKQARTKTIEENEITEDAGVSHAIYDTLKDCFKEKGKDCTYEEACDYVASKIDGWKLSKEDFEEGKKVSESFADVTSETERLDEGKMKEIAMIAQESKTKEEFKEKLKAYFKEIGKPNLGDDENFLDTLGDDWTPAPTED